MKKNQNARRKGNLQLPGNIGSRHKERWKNEMKKSISDERENFSEPSYAVGIPSKR